MRLGLSGHESRWIDFPHGFRLPNEFHVLSRFTTRDRSMKLGGPVFSPRIAGFEAGAIRIHASCDLAGLVGPKGTTAGVSAERTPRSVFFSVHDRPRETFGAAFVMDGARFRSLWYASPA